MRWHTQAEGSLSSRVLRTRKSPSGREASVTSVYDNSVDTVAPSSRSASSTTRYSQAPKTGPFVSGSLPRATRSRPSSTATRRPSMRSRSRPTGTGSSRHRTTPAYAYSARSQASPVRCPYACQSGCLPSAFRTTAHWSHVAARTCACTSGARVWNGAPCGPKTLSARRAASNSVS